MPFLQYNYESSSIDFSSMNLSNETMESIGHTNSNILATYELSKDKRSRLTSAISSPKNIIKNKKRYGVGNKTKYVLYDSKLYKISYISSSSSNTAILKKMSNKSTIDIISVSVKSFDNNTPLSIWESDRQIIRTTISRDRYRTTRYAVQNNTIVQYKDSYYLIKVLQPHNTNSS